MFFIMGISQGEKTLSYTRTVICGECGRYGRYEVFMTYMYFSFFFIPLFKWSRHYYVRMSCCGTVYELNPELGSCIEHGEEPDITQADLVRLNASTDGGASVVCSNCGYVSPQDFEYCPKCGRKLRD